jgi:hypothetical protein
MTTGVSKSTAVRGASLLGLAILGTLAVLAPGCYQPVRGNPVDTFHYEPSITVTTDHTHVIIQTYLNRNQWQVGLRREDLFDGDHDGALTSPGMDRVFITEYANVEDPPSSAQRSEGEIQNYAQTFKDVLQALAEGKKVFRIDKRDYPLRVSALDLGAPH